MKDMPPAIELNEEQKQDILNDFYGLIEKFKKVESLEFAEWMKNFVKDYPEGIYIASNLPIATKYEGEDLEEYAELIVLYIDHALGFAKEKGLEIDVSDMFQSYAIKVIFDDDTSTVLKLSIGQGSAYDIDSEGEAPSSIHYEELISKSKEA